MIVAGYALVADHCRQGGFDGIELQCSHSSIVRGFLSPAMNVRTDSYGGSLANRARILLEIVAAVLKEDTDLAAQFLRERITLFCPRIGVPVALRRRKRRELR